jgi:hypothetical protein
VVMLRTSAFLKPEYVCNDESAQLNRH